MTSFSILSTKLLNASLKEEVLAKGLELKEVEFIATAFTGNAETKKMALQWIQQPAATGVIFTSRYAVEYIGKLLQEESISTPPQWKIYCLMGATKNSVQQYFPVSQIAGTAASASELANAVIADAPAIPLVFFCGDQRREELPSLLQQKNISFTELIVYETTETPQEIHAAVDAILFFSPSTVRSFFAVNRLSENTVCFAIGATTAKTISGFTSNTIITSKTPGQQALLQEVYQYFEFNTYRK